MNNYGHMKGSKVGSSRAKGSKSYTIIKTRMVQKYFDIVTIKYFIKVMELNNFPSPLQESGI